MHGNLAYVVIDRAEDGPGGKLPAFDDGDSFLAGVAYAAQLVADEQFDF